MVDSEKLPESFYLEEDVTRVARDLLGKILWTQTDGKLTGGMIVETEAYSYLEKACHAHLNRRTRRTETLYARGGTAYIYLCYGIHHLFNIVTNTENIAEAVLVRAIEPVHGREIMQKRRGADIRDTQLTSGPGKLTVAMGIHTGMDGTELVQDDIWITRGNAIDEGEIISDVRIGVDYAEEDALLPWRFMIRDNPYLSVQPRRKTGI